MGEDKSYVVKNGGGNNKYVIYLSNEHDFTHTIIDDSETLGEIFLVRKKEEGGYENDDFQDVVHDEETQTLVILMRDSQGRHTFTGRMIIKRTKHGNVENMKLHLVDAEHYFRGCKQVPSLDSERLDCHSYDTLGHDTVSRGIGSLHWYNRAYGWHIDDRPVPSVPFHYDLNTDVEADPIPGLCGDFIISLGPYSGSHPYGGSREFSLRLPTNSLMTIGDDLMSDLKVWKAYYVLYYFKSDKKLVFEHRMGLLTEARYTIEVHVPEAKRIVFGTTGNYQFLLDLKHDNRPAVNLGSEYFGLTSRPVDEYKFTENYVNRSSKPKQLVLGVPAKTPTETRWNIVFSKAKTYAGETLEDDEEGRTATGDYAENALIVNDALWAHLSREGNDMRIIFKPPSKRRRNRWRIIVKKGKQRIHQPLVISANTLAYHEGLVRSNLYDLVNGEKRRFNLYKVWKQKMDTLKSDIIAEANRCR